MALRESICFFGWFQLEWVRIWEGTKRRRRPEISVAVLARLCSFIATEQLERVFIARTSHLVEMLVSLTILATCCESLCIHYEPLPPAPICRRLHNKSPSTVLVAVTALLHCYKWTWLRRQRATCSHMIPVVFCIVVALHTIKVGLTIQWAAIIIVSCTIWRQSRNAVTRLSHQGRVVSQRLDSAMPTPVFFLPCSWGPVDPDQWDEPRQVVHESIKEDEEWVQSEGYSQWLTFFTCEVEDAHRVDLGFQSHERHPNQQNPYIAHRCFASFGQK